MLDALIVSDIHLGSKDCNARAIFRLLLRIMRGRIRTQLLVVNGDLFDSADLGRMTKGHWKILSLLAHISDCTPIRVVMVRGNHDGELMDIFFGDLCCDYCRLQTGKFRLFVTHGHDYDGWLVSPWRRKLSDWLYRLSLAIDPSQTVARIGKKVCQSLIDAPAKISQLACQEALSKSSYTAICGHTHVPAELEVGLEGTVVRYFNGGSFTKKICTFLTAIDGKVRLEEIT